MTNDFHGVRLKKIRRVFGTFRAVDDISFEFHTGQVHGFIGPNGAGKTTTMRILSTIDTPDAGDAYIMGHSVRNEPDKVRRHIGFVPDWFTGFTHTTVHEYLDFFARACGLKDTARIRTVGEIEEFTGLLPLREKLVPELSRGMQQRVTLGRALVNNPDVLLMDEPAANLDPRARIELRELVKILAAQNKAILISSHILPELAEMCDSVTIIDKGRILASGSIEDIRHSMKPHRTIQIKALCEPEKLERLLLESPDIFNIRRVSDSFQFDSSTTDAGIAELLKHLITQDAGIFEFKLLDEALEDIFMSVTAASGETSDSSEKGKNHA